MSMQYDKLELHLTPTPLSRAQVKRIKACGGRYTECRGYSSQRFVTVPAAERELIDELVHTHNYGRVTMIARGGPRDCRPTWVDVQYVTPSCESPTERFAEQFAKAYVQATARGLIR